MNTFFNNLVAAGATVKRCANGTSAELLGHFWVFTDTKESVDLYGDGNGVYVSVPMSTKRPVVLVEKESVAWGRYKVLQYQIPLDGSKYKVFC
jgi:hypothetical protein